MLFVPREEKVKSVMGRYVSFNVLYHFWKFERDLRLEASTLCLSDGVLPSISYYVVYLSTHPMIVLLIWKGTIRYMEVERCNSVEVESGVSE